MTAAIDTLLNTLCHRGGPHADVLPLCLRCSSVYAGVALGIAFEVGLRLRTRDHPGWPALLLNLAGVAAMGIVGLGGLYGLIPQPAALKVLVGLYFGSALAFFAVSALAWQWLGDTPRRTDHLIPRIIALAALGVFTYAITAECRWCIQALGILAAAGLVAAFLTVNLAAATALLAGIRSPARRVLIAIPLTVIMAACEFALFALWRAP